MKKSTQTTDGGFTLMEVTTALLLLSVAAAGIVPLLSIVYTERAEVQAERNAYRILERVGYELEDSDSETVTVAGTSYVVRNENTAICIYWQGPARRDKDICLEFPL
ncbi:prepilin-type N-terminal cleavage/methylation domain-containing protein [Salicibibacter kimchii]|uniref:prepilin-type N-terminal cleavage/methylation domain-containing protein n=1 Tax=Salicibibacter kimchii TaxID=2099786 RepID=UPI001359B551|nr:prepilin-type N-terminal cleavage/methylation domain-containing protein [Salicibibacter kimchii]